ncbi:hypothetical protein [Gephyromycinifex aptenodytis]|uniref:hypothetical protein n=1 Tax=Gephyromycinifex aptenodytis TaxID=2716227 RepID=UPI001448418D|nr:hypothetical protein [Gephyromycinifex aptenodytis]
MSHTLVENARTTQAQPTLTTSGAQAITMAALVVVLTVVGAVASSSVIILSALVPLMGTLVAYFLWSAREVSRV